MNRWTEEQKIRGTDEKMKSKNETAVETEKPQDLGEDFFLPLKG